MLHQPTDEALSTAQPDVGHVAEVPSLRSPKGRLGAPLYADKWPNKKVAKVAAMVGQGYSGTTIVQVLNDGTTPNDIGAMVSHWGIARKSIDPRRTYADVPVPLSAIHRTQLAAEAQRRGMGLPELLQRAAETLCRDGLFGAVLDG